MTIKTEKYYAYKFLAYAILFILGGIAAIFAGAPWAVLPICFACSIFAFRGYVALARTFVIDQEGVMIILGKFSRKYSWTEFAVRRIEPGYKFAQTPLIFRFPTYKEGGAFFTVEPCLKQPTANCAIYSASYRPWKCFFVSFVPEDQMYPGYDKGIYVVNKQVFLDKLNEWGVEVDVIEKAEESI